MARVTRSLRVVLVAMILVSALPTGGNGQQKPGQQKTEAPASSAVLSSQPTPFSPPGERRNNNPLGWNDWFWQNSTTLLLAVIAVWATYVALNTLDAIRDQAKIAREALTQLERAWVVVGLKKATIQFFTNEDFLIRIILFQKNSGRSPAWVLGGVTKANKLRGPMPETPDYSDDQLHTPKPLAPSDEIELPEQVLPINTDTEAWAVVGGELKLRIYGILHYRDVFGFHETRFCLCLALKRIPQQGLPENVNAFFDGPEAYNRYT